MSTVMVTLALTFVVILGAVALLGIGWLLTGKSKIRPGACGRAPTQNKDESCGTTAQSSCHLCKKNEDDK